MSSEERNSSITEKETHLLTEIESLLSLESFARDRSLLDRLNDEGYLSVEFLLTYPTISELHVSHEEIVNAIKSSSQLSLSSDGSLVRLNIPVERKTLILRDIPDSVTEKEIQELLTPLDVRQVKKEVDSIWFAVFENESSALHALEVLQTRTLGGSPVKVRVKSEFYKKELLRRIDNLKPPHKLSSDATPFESTAPKRKMSSAAAPFIMPESHIMWGTFGLPNGVDFGYYYDPSYLQVPVVITAPSKKGYSEEFTRYSNQEIYSIVKSCKDVSLPPISEEIRQLNIICEKANTDLVGKGRTMSIDDALRRGMPRTLSVDSVDYTSMVTGSMGEEVEDKVRKHRRHAKRRAAWVVCCNNRFFVKLVLR